MLLPRPQRRPVRLCRSPKPTRNWMRAGHRRRRWRPRQRRDHPPVAARPDLFQLETPCATSPKTIAGCRSTPPPSARAAAPTCRCPKSSEACVARHTRHLSRRDQVAAAGLANVSRLVRDHGLALSGYCRGGMFPAADAAGLKAARDDNRRAVDEAAELNAACLVLVVGGLPGALQGKAARQRLLALARSQVRDGIAALLEYAKRAHVPLAIEPLHPMYAADRACINTMEHALDVCDELDPQRTARKSKGRKRPWESRWMSTTCGGPEAAAADRARRQGAPAGLPCLRLDDAGRPTCSTTAG